MGVAAGRMEGGGITSQKTGGNDPTSPLFLIQPGKKSSPGKDNPLDNGANRSHLRCGQRAVPEPPHIIVFPPCG